MISDELYTALASWLTDATSASPSKLCRYTGICNYLGDDELIIEMKAFWGEAGLSTVFPFNPIEGSHNQECDTGIIHRNPLRLAWVRKVLDEYDPPESFLDAITVDDTGEE